MKKHNFTLDVQSEIIPWFISELKRKQRNRG